jgi:WD40 repeat protein
VTFGDAFTAFEGKTWLLAENTPQTHAMRDVVWSPDSWRIAASCSDGTALVWSSFDHMEQSNEINPAPLMGSNLHSVRTPG